MADTVSRSEVIAFRLRAHNLTQRLGGEDLLDAAAPCGVQDSPPGSAVLALHARVRDVTAQQVGAALDDDRSLLRTWSMRGAPFCFPTADAHVFTTGVLPPNEKAMRHLIAGVAPAVDSLGMTVGAAVDLTAAEIGEVLSGRRLAIGDLGAELAGRIAGTLPPGQRAAWEQEGPYAPGQPLGEAVVHFCLRILTLRGVICFAPREGNQAPFVLVEEWLGHPIPDIDPAIVRAELLRRYLRCYGPSNRGDFASWLGIQAGDIDPWWRRLEDELTPVEYRGMSWILTEDLDALRSASVPDVVRLLPPHDPYTQMRDRDTIADVQHHRDVWKPVGVPGAVLVNGRIAGTWRARKSGRRLTITIRTFGPQPAHVGTSLLDEAEQIGRLRGASSVATEIRTY
ncbi:MAG: AlkZ family DNA glycosylase [Micrococcales bacterium]|nr:AlkZ family DNA glycosylase [Micrococcales bacterium]